MRRWWKQLGLVRKIILMITGILILPTALVCAVYYLTYWNSLLTQAEASLRQELNSMRTAMDDSLEEAKAVLERLDYGQELLYYMSAGCPAGEGKLDGFLVRLQEEWIDIRYAHPNRFSRLAIYTSNPGIRPAESWNLAFDRLSGADIVPAEEAPVYFGTPEARRTASGGQALDVVRQEGAVLPVWKYIREFRTGEPVGAVRLDVPLDKLVSGRELEEEYPDFHYVLSDGSGKIFFQNGDFTQLPAFGDAAAEGRVQRLRIAGEDWLALSSRCADTGLYRTVLASRPRVLQPASSMLAAVGTVALAGITLIMVLITLIVRQMLDRLLELDRVIGQTGDGDLGATVREDDYDDEISRIKHSYNEMTIRLRDLVQQVVEREKAQKDAELKALQAQINPHFLFNTLESMRMQCEIDRYYKVENGLASLGKLLRYTLRWESNEVPFAREWEYLKSYLAVMSIRWEDALACELECGPGAGEVRVPKMVLQPLVENSFQHGFRAVPAPWKLEVRAFLEGGCLKVLIRDNGSGIEADRLEELRGCLKELRQPARGEAGSHAIGLVNVAQRIDSTCRPGSGIEIGNREDGRGARILLTIVP